MSGPGRVLMAAMLACAPALAFGGAPPGASSCLGCHPVAADSSPVLSLSTLTSEQIVTAMQAFRSGSRPSTVMDRVAKGFSDEEIRAIAQWYARAAAK